MLRPYSFARGVSAGLTVEQLKAVLWAYPTR